MIPRLYEIQRKIRFFRANKTIFLSFLFSFNAVATSTITSPFNGCTFYKPRLALESFAGASDFAGCASFSAVNGRNGCIKVKGVCPACVKYNGDHLQMWLPDYFIEVTKHIGRSVFAESGDGVIQLAPTLGLALKWWEIGTASVTNPLFSNGTQSTSGRESVWHARILTVPYGAFANNYYPLKPGKGIAIPTCFSAISEFFPAQWAYNLSDGPYAAAWAPVGSTLCLTSGGALVAGALAEAKAGISKVTSSASGNIPGNPIQCATPVGAGEGFLKNALPSSDTLSPLTSGDLSKLCMGTWGNLVPRTGWIQSEDPHMSAMMAAYKFMSLAGDFHLNGDLKLRPDDKIGRASCRERVYPPRIGGKCFTPGSPLKDLPPAADNSAYREADELAPLSALKNHTYIIAVWRKRESCEEPLQFIGGWSAEYKVNYGKNLGFCQTTWGNK